MIHRSDAHPERASQQQPGADAEPTAKLRPWRRITRFLWRIRTRLLVINLITVLVPVIGIEWARTFEREGLRALERDMRHVAEALRTIAENNLDEQGRPDLALLEPGLVAIAKRTRMRVRLLDRRGGLLYDSHSAGPPEGPEPPVPSLLGSARRVKRRHAPGTSTDPGPLVDRREIRAARRGELGTATRIHQRIQRTYLFVALPVMRAHRVRGIVYITRSTIPVLVSMHRLRTRLGQVLLVALGLTALMTLFLAATISRPLTRLSRAARRIAAGDRSASLRLDRRDEIGQLARSFDAMNRQLDQRARDAADLAANVSHEFKTPLSGIRGAAELLADTPTMSDEQRDRFLRNILDDAERLDRLVSRLLELSRIEATLEQREVFDLGDLLRQSAERFGDRVSLEAHDPLPFRGHRAHLGAALGALLENGVRFGPPHEPVRIVLRPSATQISIEVRDRGPGISPSNQRRIFDRFFTTEAERGGSGIGLAIVASVVRAHGGEVTVHSAADRGTTFTLRLPLG